MVCLLIVTVFIQPVSAAESNSTVESSKAAGTAESNPAVENSEAVGTAEGNPAVENSEDQWEQQEGNQAAKKF